MLLLGLHALEGAAAPAELLAEVRRVPGLPVDADGELDAKRVLERRDEVVHDYDDSAQLPWLEDRGIALFRGAGRIDGERRVQRRRRDADARGAR